MPPMEARPTRAVYTALFGEYENLGHQPRARQSDVPFICFTDDPTLTSDSWEVRLVDAAFPLDSIRSARTIKITGHEQLEEFTETLWIDNRVTLTADPNAVLDELLVSSDLAIFEHSFRDKLIDEFSEIVRGGYDDPTRVYEQLIHYAETNPEVLEARPVWTGFIARRQTPLVRAAMATWLAHVLRYSRRDQLSINVALATPGLAPSILPAESNHESPWHEWPVLTPELGRRQSTRSSEFIHSIRAPLEKVSALELETNAQRHRLAELDEIVEAQRVEADMRYAAALEEYAKAMEVIDDLRAQLAVRDQQVIDLEEQLEATQSLYEKAKGKATARRRQVVRLRKVVDDFESSRLVRLDRALPGGRARAAQRAQVPDED